jgi:hypothetical protein
MFTLDLFQVKPSDSLEDFQKRFKNFTESASSLVSKGETDRTAENALALIQTVERIFSNETEQNMVSSEENLPERSSSMTVHSTLTPHYIEYLQLKNSTHKLTFAEEGKPGYQVVFGE